MTFGVITAVRTSRPLATTMMLRSSAVSYTHLDVYKRQVPTTPSGLRHARACYDHMAGSLGVSLHDRLNELKWLVRASDGTGYDLSPVGAQELATLGIDAAALRACLLYTSRCV